MYSIYPSENDNVERSTTIDHPPDRTKRVRDAKAEAQKEIEDYRKQKEEEFKKFESEVGRSP